MSDLLTLLCGLPHSSRTATPELLTLPTRPRRRPSRPARPRAPVDAGGRLCSPPACVWLARCPAAGAGSRAGRLHLRPAPSRKGRRARRLERGSASSRGAAGRAVAEQVLAANLDVVLVVQGLDAGVQPRRLERTLAAVHQGGAAAGGGPHQVRPLPGPGRRARGGGAQRARRAGGPRLRRDRRGRGSGAGAPAARDHRRPGRSVGRGQVHAAQRAPGTDGAAGGRGGGMGTGAGDTPPSGGLSWSCPAAACSSTVPASAS